MSATVLDRAAPQLRDFNPARREDLAELHYFIEKGRWRTSCPFALKEPNLSVPHQCLSEFTRYRLNKMFANGVK